MLDRGQIKITTNSGSCLNVDNYAMCWKCILMQWRQKAGNGQKHNFIIVVNLAFFTEYSNSDSQTSFWHKIVINCWKLLPIQKEVYVNKTWSIGTIEALKLIRLFVPIHMWRGVQSQKNVNMEGLGQILEIFEGLHPGNFLLSFLVTSEVLCFNITYWT